MDGWPPTPHCTSWLKGYETEISTPGLELKGLVPSYLLTYFTFHIVMVAEKWTDVFTGIFWGWGGGGGGTWEDLSMGELLLGEETFNEGDAGFSSII